MHRYEPCGVRDTVSIVRALTSHPSLESLELISIPEVLYSAMIRCVPNLSRLRRLIIGAYDPMQALLRTYNNMMDDDDDDDDDLQAEEESSAWSVLRGLLDSQRYQIDAQRLRVDIRYGDKRSHSSDWLDELEGYTDSQVHIQQVDTFVDWFDKPEQTYMDDLPR
jgi:hypothetical protein